MKNNISQVKANKTNVIKSLIWKFLERGGTQGVQFIIQIILARLLTPNDYGMLAILLAFVAFANVFVQSGFSTALIQKQDSDQLDFSSVLYFSIFIALIVYLIIFLTAPLIGKFYDNKNLVLPLRIIAIILFFGAITSVQNVVVAKQMQFKNFFFSSTGGAVFSGIIGIILAYNGFGIWALVAQQVSNNILICVILWFSIKWRPDFSFSIKRIKKLFSFGWKLLCSSIIYTGYQQFYSLAIGRKFSSADLGIFSRGESFPSIISNNLNGAVQSVMLPAMSSHNDNIEDVKNITRRTITFGCYVLMPLLFGMAAVAKPMVLVLLTDKWLQCVPFIRLSCISFSFYFVHTTNLTAMNSVGRSDLYLKLEITKTILGIVIFIITMPFGLLWIAKGRIISAIIDTFINSYPNKKLLNYGCLSQWRDILPILSASAFMSICVYFFGLLPITSNLILLLLQIILGICIYLLISKIFHFESFYFALNMLKSH